MGTLPAFTVLNDDIDLPGTRQEPVPAWQSMYQANILSAPQNSPFSNYEVPAISADYETLTYQSAAPEIPQAYDNSRANNFTQLGRNIAYGLPAEPPAPLPGHLGLPMMPAPPYGTAYPSSRRSAFDGEVAMKAGVPAYYALPGIPAASPPSLQDGRDSPTVPMNPYSLALVAEQHYKEGFARGKEAYSPSCSECVAHIQGCPICDHFVNGHKRLYQIAIGFLIILVLILLWMLFRRVSSKGAGPAGATA